MLTVTICIVGVAILAGSLWLRASPDRGGWTNGGLGELLIAYSIPLW